jgi:anti-sigma regulatory factor (Ser/Thr protein kinase)
MAATTGVTDAIGLELPFVAESARVARQRLLEYLGRVPTPEEVREDARLVVSELVGNAVRHARPLANGTVRVAWTHCPIGLDIAVTDGGARTAPHHVDAGVSDVAGRGLAIVEAVSARWWVESDHSRTTVHALLACG